MNEYDDILNRIVEKFYDTGRLVLNELDLPDETRQELEDLSDELKQQKQLVYDFFGELKKGRKESNKGNYIDSVKFRVNALEIYENNPEIQKVIRFGKPGRKNIIDNIKKDISEDVSKIKEYLNDLIKEGKNQYQKGEYQSSIGSYEEVINIYTDLPNFVKPIEFISNIETLESWIKISENILSDIERQQQIGSTPIKTSDEFREKLLKWREEHPEYFESIETEEDLEKEIQTAGNEFRGLIKNQIELDGSYRYGMWSIGLIDIENGELKNLERIFELQKPKSENEITTTITIDDVKNSVMDVLLSDEGRKLIKKESVFMSVPGQRHKSVSYIGNILTKMIGAKLIKPSQLPNTTNETKKIFGKIKDKIKNLKDTIQITEISVDDFLSYLGFDELDTLDIKYVSTKEKPKATQYEESFGNLCDDIKYFELTKGEGNSSKISNDYSYNKTLLNKVSNPNLDIDKDIIPYLYKDIVTTETVKYDIKTLVPVNLEGGFVLEPEDPVEVKDTPYENGYHLIEFYGTFKNFTKSQKKDFPFMDRFESVITKLSERLQKDVDNESGKGWEIIKSINDVTVGIFFSEYNFLPKDSYKLKWSTEGARPYEHRLTIRVDYIQGSPVYKWIEGNCHLQQNESTDRLDEIIENFFDTGNFDI
jgi:hypothetical protein